jgi:CO/xanthine dehydrogenase Mo-binding subunit
MYVQDMRLPNMVHARMVRPPAARARLISVTTEDTLKLPGVIKVIVDGSFLAVIATREEQAIRAAAHLRAQAEWKMANDLPPSGEALFEYMLKQTTLDDVVSQKTSSVGSAKIASTQSFKQRYTRPYIAHASIGPSCALALWERPSRALSEDHLKVWCHSQGVFPLRNDLSKALRLSKEQITVAHAEGSGCYGHNAADDVALDAALIARHMPGVPIRLQWMREDEFGWEPLGSPMVVEIEAQIDTQGFITNWQHELWSYTHSTRPYDPDGCNLLASWYVEQSLKPGPSRNIPQPSGGSDRNAVPLYDFQNHKVINHLIQFMPIRTSALRTLGAFCNVLAIESFLDEIAFESKQDPVDFRLKHLNDSRAKAVIQDVAKMADWRTMNEGFNSSGGNNHEKRAKGIAFAKYKNMAVYCAVVAQVCVNLKTKTIRVEKAFASVDAGLIINPNGLRNQIEGGLVQATSWSLFEQMSYDQTQLKTKNWGDYSILKFNEVPEIIVNLINRPEEKSLGVGEGAHGPMAAAVANAVFAACGARLRSTPFKLPNQFDDQNKKTKAKSSNY